MRGVLLTILMIASFQLRAQFSVENISYDFATSEDATSYFQPIGQSYSAMLHSGIFPRYSEKGFHIKIGLHVSRLSLYSNLKSFEVESGTYAPTIVGSTEPLVINADTQDEKTYPAGNDINEIILGAPELYIGTLLGTDFYGRYGQLGLDGNLGDLVFYGGGIRHDFGRYFLPEYVKWYLSYNYHELSIGESVSSVNQYGLTQLGVKLNRIGFYGLFGYELNDMNLTHDFDNQSATIDLDDAKPFRYGGGFNLSFKYIELYGEYNINDPVALLVGFSVGI
ncbi:DUF6588 family protein [Portibacter lacus]|uniref:Outer membrane protein beta-barrel domain-containing protein n=1 Tax=Portibacter lacus TaxID=1099794 RepID=A0AA37SRJ6_9BACT|nr:DUF6588 family protein [Portibacter lacus]GLR17526.1 hypothetical protein GCM10007940_21410 [Portibacter lacus]